MYVINHAWQHTDLCGVITENHPSAHTLSVLNKWLNV